MITIYAPEAQDFSTLGLGALAPYECVIEEQAGGMYELTMTHPMDAEGKWLNIGVGCIVKAPAPVRETPLVESEIVGEGEATEPVTVTRKIYKVQTNTGANLHLRQGPSTSTAILSKYRPGTEVVVLSQASGWGQVIVCSSGATGYMSMQYLVYVRDETETIEGDAPGPERVVYPVQSRMQLFRIFKVERDAAEREVRVEARHIFYDLLGNVVKNEYAPEGEAADAVVEELFERALNAHDFSVHCQTARSVTGEYTRRGLVECLLDPDDGVLPQTGARLVRDNFDVWILPDATRETGVTIRHGKNLLGATLTTDWDSLVTRIIPVGQDKEGKALLLEGTTYMDSPHIGDYPVICAQAVEYDVKIGQEGIDNAAQARAKLQELAAADFADNGVDLPTVGLDVDFVALGETEEYRQYADLEAVHLYDTVRVIAKSAGIDAAVRVTGYKWDALGKKYESVTLGEITDLKTTVYGYELQRGSVKTIKIAPGAVDSAQLRELAVQYAHINTAAVEQLSANSITALKAYITEIVAGSVTTDELYAGIASIALAQITTANIENANIDWAQIGTLSADIATIAKAHLTDADIDWAQIANLTAAVAEIAEAKIAGATIGSAQIDDLEAVVAEIIHAQVATGEFDFAEVENFLGSVFILGQGIAGTVSIENLMVTRANMLNATVQTLILPGTDGKYYQITVGTDGQLSTEEVTVTDSEIAAGETEDGRQIVATTINAEVINGSTVTAQQAVLNTVLTQALTAGKITAGEALIASASIPTLYVTSVEALGNSMTFSANEQIQMIVGNVQQAQETADSAQEAAEQAAPYISATPPEEAPEAGKLWLDEGVEPSVLRKWRGADVTTEREYTETRVGCGKNLLDIAAFSPSHTTGVHVDVEANTLRVYTTDTGGTWRAANSKPFWVRRGITYKISATLSAYDGGYSTIVMRRVADNTIVDGSGIAFGGQTGRKVGQFTPTEDIYVYLSAFCTNDTITSGDCTYTQIQLEIGETATAFEPYEDIPFLALDNGAGQMQSVAVEVGCRAKQETRKNLFRRLPSFESGNATVEVAADGKATVNITNAYADVWSRDSYGDQNNTTPLFTVAEDTPITLSGGTANVHVAVQYITATGARGMQGTEGQPSKTFTLAAGASLVRQYIRVPANTAVNGEVVSPQMELGSAATAYEPYKESLTITGRESVEIAACGKNLYDVSDRLTFSDGVTVDADGWITATADNSAGSGIIFKNCFTYPSLAIRPSTQYAVVCEIAQINVTGQLAFSIVDLYNDPQALSQFAQAFSLTVNENTQTGTRIQVLTSRADLSDAGSMLRTYVAFTPGASGTIKFRLSVLADTAITEETFVYEPYRSMGGGTIAPTEPLYGLPGAEDTVEVSTDGDVTVARRTGTYAITGAEAWTAATSAANTYYFDFTNTGGDITPQVLIPGICSHYKTAQVASIGAEDKTFAHLDYTSIRRFLFRDDSYTTLEAWKTYLAAQKTAGTPVTIVYELAAPETEALTAISPIAPQAGQLNLVTDADALTATIRGSGWETVNDTNDIRAALAEVDSDVAGLIAGMGMLEGTVAQLGEQIITPEGVVSIVAASDGYQALVNMANQSADGLELVRVTVSNLNGRVETLEEGVHIEGSNVGLYSSGSPFRMDIDHTGIGISENGQPTITVRESRADIPRITTQTLILGGFAYRAGENDLYQMIV